MSVLLLSILYEITETISHHTLACSPFSVLKHVCRFKYINFYNQLLEFVPFHSHRILIKHVYVHREVQSSVKISEVMINTQMSWENRKAFYFFMTNDNASKALSQYLPSFLCPLWLLHANLSTPKLRYRIYV